MSDLKNKYLKYKQKYLNLKQMIGGGIDATYEITGDQLTVKFNFEGENRKINYTLNQILGEGGNGIVYLITNNNNKQQYIFKIGKHPSLMASYIEGTQSNLLEKILDLDKDMLVLFQGKSKSDFLISTYNGNDLYEEFKNKPEQIKDKYAIITTQLLDLLHKINRKNIFHNDIKLANVTIKNDKVYLIDFGLLSEKKSNIGSLMSMSYNGVIAFLKDKKYNYYSDTYKTLQKFLKDTDIVGFFYCCIDLLFLTVIDSHYSVRLLYRLNILNYDKNNLYNLFELFYFILPNSNRNIPKLNEQSRYYNQLLPSEDETNQIFSDFPPEHINLFRFMASIYKRIDHYLIIKNKKQQIWYTKFLKIMSDCFLPDFNYESFELKFNEIVLEFSKLPELPDGSAPAPDPVPVPAPAPAPVPVPVPVPVPDPVPPAPSPLPPAPAPLPPAPSPLPPAPSPLPPAPSPVSVLPVPVPSHVSVPLPPAPSPVSVLPAPAPAPVPRLPAYRETVDLHWLPQMFDMYRGKTGQGQNKIYPTY